MNRRPANLLEMSKPSEFFVPAQDKQGHSAKISFRITPYMSVEIAKILEKKEWFDWESSSDFYRYALKLGMQDLEKRIEKGHPDRWEEIAGDVSLNHAILDAALLEHQKLSFKDTFATVERTVQELMSDGAQERVIVMLLNIQKKISKMDGWYRKRWQEEFKARLAHHLKAANLLGGKRK